MTAMMEPSIASGDCWPNCVLPMKAILVKKETGEEENKRLEIWRETNHYEINMIHDLFQQVTAIVIVIVIVIVMDKKKTEEEENKRLEIWRDTNHNENKMSHDLFQQGPRCYCEKKKPWNPSKIFNLHAKPS